MRFFEGPVTRISLAVVLAIGFFVNFHSVGAQEKSIEGFNENLQGEIEDSDNRESPELIKPTIVSVKSKSTGEPSAQRDFTFHAERERISRERQRYLIELEKHEIELDRFYKETNPFSDIRVILLLAGAVIAVWRSWVALNQLKLNQQGQANDRFLKAVEQLNLSETEVSVVDRLAGIYALEKLIEEDPKRYKSQVVNLLVSFLKIITPVNPDQLSEEVPARDEIARAQGTHEPNPSIDVQEVLKVLGRNNPASSRFRVRRIQFQDRYSSSNMFRRIKSKLSNFKPSFTLDLSSLDLRGADLSDLDLRGANLGGTDLRSARLHKTNLKWAKLWNTKLDGAILHEADFSHANIMDSTFKNANLAGAIFKMAACFNADFKNAVLSRANLFRSVFDVSAPGCDFREADFQWANLAGSFMASGLQGAKFHNCSMTKVSSSYANFRGAVGIQEKYLADMQVNEFTVAPTGQRPGTWPDPANDTERARMFAELRGTFPRLVIRH